MEVEYVNGFNCAINNQKDEVVISLFRTLPKINDEGDFDGAVLTKAGIVILNRETAENLVSSLTQMLSDSENSDNA